MKKRTKCGAWKAEPYYARLHSCVVMLNCHGMLTDAERRRVVKRLLKLIERDKKS